MFHDGLWFLMVILYNMIRQLASNVFISSPVKPRRCQWDTNLCILSKCDSHVLKLSIQIHDTLIKTRTMAPDKKNIIQSRKVYKQKT